MCVTRVVVPHQGLETSVQYKESLGVTVRPYCCLKWCDGRRGGPSWRGERVGVGGANTDRRRRIDNATNDDDDVVVTTSRRHRVGCRRKTEVGGHGEGVGKRGQGLLQAVGLRCWVTQVGYFSVWCVVCVCGCPVFQYGVCLLDVHCLQCLLRVRSCDGEFLPFSCSFCAAFFCGVVIICRQISLPTKT